MFDCLFIMMQAKQKLLFIGKEVTKVLFDCDIMKYKQIKQKLLFIGEEGTKEFSV